MVICHHWWSNGKGASDGCWEVPDIKDAEGLRIKIDIWKDGKIGPADWNDTNYYNVKFISFRAKAPAAGATRYTAWAPRLP